MGFDKEAATKLMSRFTMPNEAYKIGSDNHGKIDTDAVKKEAVTLGLLRTDSIDEGDAFQDLISQGVVHYNFNELDKAAIAFENAFALQPFSVQSAQGLAQLYAKRHTEDPQSGHGEMALRYARFAMGLSRTADIAADVFFDLTEIPCRPTHLNPIKKRPKLVLGSLVLILLGLAFLFGRVQQQSVQITQPNSQGEAKQETVKPDVSKTSITKELKHTGARAKQSLEWIGNWPFERNISDSRFTLGTTANEGFFSFNGLLTNRSDNIINQIEFVSKGYDSSGKVVFESIGKLPSFKKEIRPGDGFQVYHITKVLLNSNEAVERITLEPIRLTEQSLADKELPSAVVPHQFFKPSKIEGLSLQFENREKPAPFQLPIFYRNMSVTNSGDGAISQLKIRFLHHDESDRIVWTSETTTVIYNTNTPLPNGHRMVFAAKDQQLKAKHRLSLEVMAVQHQ